MFDLGFSEIVVIAVIALIVIGPEKLPGVARTLGHLFGRMQRYVNDVKSDIQREMELDELKKLRQSVEDSARSIEQSVTREIAAPYEELSQELRELKSLADPSSEPAPAPSPPQAAVPPPPSVDPVPPAVHKNG